MFNFLRSKAAAEPKNETPLPTKPAVEQPEAAVPEPELNLISAGTQRADPINQQEHDFAAAYKDAVSNCHSKFAEPGFDLPTLPASALRVLNLIQGSDISSKKIAHTLQMDPVLTAKFLRLANSAMYAGTRKVESVQVAIDRLGMATVRSVVLAISLNSTIIREKRMGQGAMQLWEHSINTGVASQKLAATFGFNQSLAFTLGLMHDIGKLAAWLLVNTTRREGMLLRPQFINTLVEDTHTKVGEALVEVWNMPIEVKLAVGGHHIVSNLHDAVDYVGMTQPGDSAVGPGILPKLLGAVVLADRSLAALGLAEEPGDLTVGDSGLAIDLGFSKQATLEYLMNLPTILKENDMKDL